MNQNQDVISGSHLIKAEEDFLSTLRNCQGYYECPTDANGKPKGPLVGYTAKYKEEDGSEKNWVGFVYYNFSKADLWPAILNRFAQRMYMKLVVENLFPDVIVGAPWAGIKFSQEVARLCCCRHIFAEKKGDEVILGRYEGAICPGDEVIIGEELVNNASTTSKLVSLIEDAGGKVIGIICAINRSSPFKKEFCISPDSITIPILGVVEKETPQYRQDDPLVLEAIAEGQVVWKPKYEWKRMEAAMSSTEKQ